MCLFFLKVLIVNSKVFTVISFTKGNFLYLSIPWTARRSNQSILKEIVLNIHWKDWCLSWNYSNLPTWCEELLIWKDPDAGKDWRQEKKGWQRMRWLDSITAWMVRSLSKLRELVMDRGPGMLQSTRSQRVGHDWVTELNSIHLFIYIYIYKKRRKKRNYHCELVSSQVKVPFNLRNIFEKLWSM